MNSGTILCISLKLYTDDIFIIIFLVFFLFVNILLVMIYILIIVTDSLLFKMQFSCTLKNFMDFREFALDSEKKGLMSVVSQYKDVITLDELSVAL